MRHYRILIVMFDEFNTTLRQSILIFNGQNLFVSAIQGSSILNVKLGY